MVIRIPAGRIYEWAKDAYQSRTPNEFSRAHPFLNAAGEGFDQVNRSGGSGDRWCVRCGRLWSVHVSPQELGLDAVAALFDEGAMIYEAPLVWEVRRELFVRWLREQVDQIRIIRGPNASEDSPKPEPDGSLSPLSVVTHVDQLVAQAEAQLRPNDVYEVIARLLGAMPEGGPERAAWRAEVEPTLGQSAVLAARLIRATCLSVRDTRT